MILRLAVHAGIAHAAGVALGLATAAAGAGVLAGACTRRADKGSQTSGAPPSGPAGAAAPPG